MFIGMIQLLFSIWADPSYPNNRLGMTPNCCGIYIPVTMRQDNEIGHEMSVFDGRYQFRFYPKKAWKDIVSVSSRCF